MSQSKEKAPGVVYILTNPSFPQYVKIGYADDIEERLKTFNNTTCVPFAFRVYATYEVPKRLSDMKIHDIIDKINPDLRSIDYVDGKKREREFFAMPPEDAYCIFEAIAELSGTESRLKLWPQTAKQKQDDELAEEISKENEIRKKARAFTFSSCGIPVGEKVSFIHRDNAYSGTEVVVVDDKHVEYQERNVTLSALAKEFLGRTSHHIPGPSYFQYKGKWLNDIRRENELINF